MREHFSDLHLDFYVNQVLYSGYHQRRQKGSKFLSKMQSTQAQIEDKDETDEGFMFNHFEAELFKDNPPATLPT